MIGLLNAYWIDGDPKSYQARYEPMVLDYLKQVMPDIPVRSYQVAQGEFPQTLQECKAWIVTGSSASAYDDSPWIQKLGLWIQSAHQARHKLIGICFGHQMVAHYLGGRVEKSSKGWGVGVRTFEVSQSQPWMVPLLKECSLLFSHQDQVVKLAEGTTVLAQDEFCEYQLCSIGDHILTLQGHPEFTAEFARERLDSRIERMGRETYLKAVESLDQVTHSQEMGSWMKEFILE